MSIQGQINELADLLHKPRIKAPQKIRIKVDFAALQRIKNQIRKDKERGLLK